MGTLIRNNFTGGEVAPAIQLRPELAKNQAGLRVCENYIVKPTGGISFRPGTSFCGTATSAGSGAEEARVIPFVFSDTQSYVLVFAQNAMRVFRDGAALPIASIPVALSPASIKAMDYCQNADVLILAIPGLLPKKVTRSSDTSWAVADLVLEGDVDPPEFAYVAEPFTSVTHTGGDGTTDYNMEFDTGAATSEVNAGDVISVYPGLFPTILTGGRTYQFIVHSTVGVSGTVRIRVHTDIQSAGATDTTDGAIFVCKGAVPYGVAGGTYGKDYRYVVTAVHENGEESPPSLPITAPGTITYTLTSTYGVRLRWTHPSPEGIAYYRVYKDLSGDGISFGWIGDATACIFTDYNIAPIASDSPPAKTLSAGRPSAAAFYQQRLCTAGDTSAPLKVTASYIGKPFLMTQSRPIKDGDAFDLTISAPRQDPIQYIVPLDSLLLFTKGAEWRTTEGDSEVFTVSTAGVRMMSANGCARVKPVVVNDSVLYVQAKGSRLREMGYAVREDRYGGVDLSIMASHLFENGTIVDMAYSDEPDGVLWCVLSDGSVASLTYQKEHEVVAWHRHYFGGSAKSVAVIPEGGEDVVYFAIVRGGVVRIERMRSRSAATRYGMDSYLSYSGPATATFTGMSHLDGATVTALADGAVVTGLTVAGGSVTLPFAASDVTIGLPYIGTAVLLPVIKTSARGVVASLGEPASVSRIRAHVIASRGVKCGVMSPTMEAPPPMTEAYPRHVNDSYDPQDLYTGCLEVQIPGNWDSETCLLISQDAPFPQNILAIEYEVDV